MQTCKVVFIAAIFSILLTPSVFAQTDNSWTGNINAFLGSKALDKDDWEPVEEQGEIGIKIDFKQQSWPVSIAIDFLASESDEERGLFYDPSFGIFEAAFQGRTSELNLGVRKIWDHFPHVRPFIGGGLSFIRAEGEVSAFGDSVSDDDAGTGLWIGGGVYWTLADHFNIGLELMASSAEVTIFDTDVNAGGGHFGVLAGYHW